MREAWEHGKILVVDDSESVRTLLAAMLKGHGLKVRTAGNGEEALAIVEANPPDLILLDVLMPGLGGYEMCRLLKGRPESAEIPVIFVSGASDTGNKVEGFAVGGVDYVTKPFAEEEVVARVRAHLGLYLLRRRLERQNSRLQEEIVQRERAEETMRLALAQAEAANQAKSEFLANMSHELRTPMHAILSFSGMGREKANPEYGDKLPHYFSRIHDSGERLLVLLNDLLDLAKLEAGRMEFQPETSDLRELVALMVDELDGLVKEHGVDLWVDASGGGRWAFCDRARILQVLRNLLSNAIKFTPEGRTIRLFFDDAVMNDGAVGVAVSVADQGVGIPPDELAAVFDKFVQSSKTKNGAGGTGLGLAICKEIVEGHGGTIQAANNADGGATFTFTLPTST